MTETQIKPKTTLKAKLVKKIMLFIADFLSNFSQL